MAWVGVTRQGHGYGLSQGTGMGHIYTDPLPATFSYTRYLLIAVQCLDRRYARRARVRTFLTVRGIWARYHVCAPRKPPIRLDPDALRARINRQHTMTCALTLTHGLPSPFPLRRSRQKAPRRTRHSHPAWET